MTHKEKAIELLKQKYDCSQALLGAFAGDFGLDLKTVFKISTCFGGGMRQGTTCGCITGGLLVLGLAFGFSDPQGRELENYGNRKTEEYIRTFRERMQGDVYCRDILSKDIFIPGETAVIRREGLILQNCLQAFLVSIEILEKMLREYGGELLSMDLEDTDADKDGNSDLAREHEQAATFQAVYAGTGASAGAEAYDGVRQGQAASGAYHYYGRAVKVGYYRRGVEIRNQEELLETCGVIVAQG